MAIPVLRRALINASDFQLGTATNDVITFGNAGTAPTKVSVELVAKAENLVLASGPTTSTSQPAFRYLVAADLPAPFNAFDSGWQNITLGGGWVNYGGGYTTPQYRKIGGVVFLKGAIKSGTITDGTTLFTLAAGYRPPQHMFTQVSGGVASGAGQGNIDINATTGAVKLYNMTGNGFVTFDNISFVAS